MKYITNFVVTILFFVILTILVATFPQVTTADIEIIKVIQKLMAGQPLDVPLFMAGFAYGHRLIIPTIVLAAILLIKRKYISCILATLTIQGAFFYSDALKGIIMRARPPFELRLCPIDGYSFPSGHSLMSMCYFGICIYLINRYVKNEVLKKTLNILFGGYILFVGFTRLWLGVHFPTDIIGGYLAGLFLVYIFAELDEKLQSHLSKNVKNRQ